MAARPPFRIDAADGVHLHTSGRRLTSFAGCDLLGLARHPEVVRAGAAAFPLLGAGAGASRTTTGTFAAHEELESEIASFFGEDDAVTFPAGWLSAQALVRALAGDADSLLLDDGAHPALLDSAALSGLPARSYSHFDAASARAAARHAGRVLILTDGVDPARGRVAPLRALARVAKTSGGRLVVDDAHGVGVLGARGRGAVELARAAGPHVHVAGSLSKAFGTQGGFVAGDAALCRAIRTRAAVYAGATPLAPPLAEAARAAVLLARDGTLRRSLAANAARMRRRFERMGLAPPPHRVPWFAVSGRPARVLAKASARLADAGFLVPHIRYFGGPREGMLKIAVSAAHTPEQIDGLAAALKSVFRSKGRPPVFGPGT